VYREGLTYGAFARQRRLELRLIVRATSAKKSETRPASVLSADDDDDDVPERRIRTVPIAARKRMPVVRDRRARGQVQPQRYGRRSLP
jgi:hypothetical protein